MKNILNITLVLATITAMNIGNTFADEASIKLTMIAEKEVVTTDKDGNKVITRVEPKLVTPGEDLIYTTRYHNKGKETADDVAITNPVPEHMTYLDGSAEGTNTITYSVDGGNRFADPSKLMVTGKDGKTRPASAKDYTHIRWTLERLAPDASGQVSFKAKLN